MTMLDWQELGCGIWKTVVGEQQDFTPMSWMSREPLFEALEQMQETTLPFAMSDIQLEAVGSSRILRLPLQEDEKLYGLGLHFMKMNHRGRTRYLRVNSDPKQDTGETHAPVPFLVTDRGYGVLVNTSRIVTVHCGSTVKLNETALERVKDRNNDRKSWKATPLSDYIEIVLPQEGAELYLIGGPGLMDAVRRYNLLCGGGTLPPKWGLGFWHRVPTLYTDKEVQEEAMEFRNRDFPCDVIGLEPGWHSKSYPVTYEWAKERFPEPKKTIDALTEARFRVNLWEHPYVSPESKLYEPLEPLSGSYSVWGGLAPDYSLPEAQRLYQEQHLQEHVSLGVSGYKQDECDGSELTGNSWMFPSHTQFPSGHDGEQMRQMYGLMFQKMTDDLFRTQNRRTYGLVRASNAGASSMPYVLYSDLYDHKQFIRALCNSSFSGLLWTPEVRRASSAEDWVRRMQAVCLSPLAMLNAWGDGTKPWSYPEVEPIIRHYIKLRMRLIPYLYTTFAQYRFQGIPPFRAMPLVMDMTEGFTVNETGRALNTTDGAYGKKTEKLWDDQFMIGDSLLVAPMFAGETTREVLLPNGGWFGLETGERYEGGQVIQVEPGLEQMPIFVKEGAILPTIPAHAHAQLPGEKVQLHLVHFGNKPGQALLYDDDGETFDYEKGDRCWAQLEVHGTGNSVDQGNEAFEGKLSEGLEALFSFNQVKWTFGASRLPEE
ncbi:MULTISPECIES: TIM-barrel domain-containing protein [unclassified Paenibacillus]|uniref:TIM-barrel domain-containing protein n=1 Tax=unclassified Paenibacillus TaxID=185978 RepID=UPI003625A68F